MKKKVIRLTERDLGSIVRKVINESKDRVKGGVADDMTPEKVAKKHGVKVEDIKKQLVKGVKVEMEHTDSKRISKEIALDHLYEDPKYYDKLETIHVDETISYEATQDLCANYGIGCPDGKNFKRMSMFSPTMSESIDDEYGWEEDELGGRIEKDGDKWISKAIKKPGSLRRSMDKDEDEEISSSELDRELAKLRAKDKDSSEKGVQGLGTRDLTKYRRLNLAKTLSGFKR